MTKNILVFGLLLLSDLALGQVAKDWPSTTVSLSSEDSNQSEELEHYESGYVFAQGSLKKSGFRKVVKLTEDEGQVNDTIYDYFRVGIWTVYYDSTIKIVKSRGEYVDGKKNGLWKRFNKQGELCSEYVFVDDLIKTQIEIGRDGKRNVILNRSGVAIFFLNNKFLLFMLGLLPIVGIRSFWNIVVWNKIYRTNYIPGFTKFKKGEFNANFYSVIIFWWFKSDGDDSEIRMFKKIGNWISILSLFIFGVFVTLMSLASE